jgi:hypothetical protein
MTDGLSLQQFQQQKNILTCGKSFPTDRPQRKPALFAQAQEGSFRSRRFVEIARGLDGCPEKRRAHAIFPIEGRAEVSLIPEAGPELARD